MPCAAHGLNAQTANLPGGIPKPLPPIPVSPTIPPHCPPVGPLPEAPNLKLPRQRWQGFKQKHVGQRRPAGIAKLQHPRVLYIYIYICGVLEGFRSKSSKCSTRLLWPCHLVKPPYATGHNRHFQKLPVEFVDSKEILLLESTSNAGYKNITAFLTRLFEIVNPGTLRIHTFQAPSPSRGCTIELR